MSINISRYTPEDEDFDRVSDQLTKFTLGKGGPLYQPLKFAFKAVSDRQVVGELVGATLWGVADITLLHVDPAHRKRGIGKKLLAAAEEFAEANGAKGAQLSTFSFQGEGFYERAGYKEVARFPMNTEGYFNGEQQDKILYYKSLDLDMVKAAQAGDYAAIAAYAIQFPEQALAKLDAAAAADPKLGEGLTPYFTKTRFLVLDVEDIRLRLEIKAIPKRFARGLFEPAKPQAEPAEVTAGDTVTIVPAPTPG